MRCCLTSFVELCYSEICALLLLYLRFIHLGFHNLVVLLLFICLQDIASLGIVGDAVSHTSDFFDVICDYAR